MLWQRSLVMMDKETESLWSHLLGKCMDGELKGTVLKTLPGSLTDWESWKEKYPETKVLLMRRTAQSFTREMYTDLRHFVAGMSDGKNSKAWSFADLKDNPIINDTFADQPVVVVFDKKSSTPFVFDCRVDGVALTFAEENGKYVDKQTGSEWDLEYGVGTEGSMKGKKLKPLVVISSFSRAWSNFHPESEYWIPEE